MNDRLWVWHDDIRCPPHSRWVWGRTNDEVLRLLRTGHVTNLSLDHDMGLSDRNPIEPGVAHIYDEGIPGQSGYDLVRTAYGDALLADLVITVHSRNPWGARRIYDFLEKALPRDSAFDPRFAVILEYDHEDSGLAVHRYHCAVSDSQVAPA